MEETEDQKLTCQKNKVRLKLLSRREFQCIEVRIWDANKLCLTCSPVSESRSFSSSRPFEGALTSTVWAHGNIA